MLWTEKRMLTGNTSQRSKTNPCVVGKKLRRGSLRSFDCFYSSVFHVLSKFRGVHVPKKEIRSVLAFIVRNPISIFFNHRKFMHYVPRREL